MPDALPSGRVSRVAVFHGREFAGFSVEMKGLPHRVALLALPVVVVV